MNELRMIFTDRATGQNREISTTDPELAMRWLWEQAQRVSEDPSGMRRVDLVIYGDPRPPSRGLFG